MADTQDKQPTAWGTSTPGPLQNDDLVEEGTGADGELRTDNRFDTSLETSDADLAASALGTEENDDLDSDADEDTEPEPEDGALFDDEDVVSEGGALDHDGTHNVYSSGSTGGGTMDDDESFAPNQRQPDRMALDRATISEADLEPSPGSTGKVMWDSANPPSTAGDERLPGEDTLDSFREHETVVASYIGGDVGTDQSATPDDTAEPSSEDQKTDN